jgi:hypothetical protein
MCDSGNPKRTNDDETSPPESVYEVDLELGVCPGLFVGIICDRVFLASLYFTAVPE